MEPVSEVVLRELDWMSNVLHVGFFKQQLFLLGIGVDAHGNVGGYDYISPITSHQATCFLLLFSSWGIGGQRSVWLRISRKSLLESQPC